MPACWFAQVGLRPVYTICTYKAHSYSSEGEEVFTAVSFFKVRKLHHDVTGHGEEVFTAVPNTSLCFYFQTSPLHSGLSPRSLIGLEVGWAAPLVSQARSARQRRGREKRHRGEDLFTFTGVWMSLNVSIKVTTSQSQCDIYFALKSLCCAIMCTKCATC